MTTPAMNLSAIVGDMKNAFLASSNELHKSFDVNGNGYYSINGNLVNGRPAVVIVAQPDAEIIHVKLGIAGGGNLGVTFQLFADEATGERVARYIAYIKEKHEKAVAEWDASK